MMKLSEFVILAMTRMLKNPVESGELIYGQPITIELEFDTEECFKMLRELSINPDNVLKYLAHKYKPSWNAQGAVFLGQKCIQKAIINDNQLTVYIHNSEIHKTITDTAHVINLLKQHGFTFSTSNVRYKIENLKMIYQDALIYVEFLNLRNLPVPIVARDYIKDILGKYPRLSDIVKIKKRSIKRKYLRYYVQKGWIEWNDLRKVIGLEDYSDIAIKTICKEIIDSAAIRGVNIK